MKIGETNVVIRENGYQFKVVKEEDDPLTNRLSIGGSKEDGCYIVFRGDITTCRDILEQATITLTDIINKS